MVVGVTTSPLLVLRVALGVVTPHLSDLEVEGLSDRTLEVEEGFVVVVVVAVDMEVASDVEVVLDVAAVEVVLGVVGASEEEGGGGNHQDRQIQRTTTTCQCLRIRGDTSCPRKAK
jgi:hypothetical protein